VKRMRRRLPRCPDACRGAQITDQTGRKLCKGKRRKKGDDGDAEATARASSWHANGTHDP